MTRRIKKEGTRAIDKATTRPAERERPEFERGRRIRRRRGRRNEREENSNLAREKGDVDDKGDGGTTKPTRRARTPSTTRTEKKARVTTMIGALLPRSLPLGFRNGVRLMLLLLSDAAGASKRCSGGHAMPATTAAQAATPFMKWSASPLLRRAGIAQRGSLPLAFSRSRPLTQGT